MKITTKWGEKIDKNNPLPEYPRPQFERDSFINLNGVWSYLISKKKTEIPTAFEGEIVVPFSPECQLSRCWEFFITVPSKPVKAGLSGSRCQRNSSQMCVLRFCFGKISQCVLACWENLRRYGNFSRLLRTSHRAYASVIS